MPESNQAFPYRDYQRDAAKVQTLLQRSRLWLYLVLLAIVLTPLISFGYYHTVAKTELEEQERQTTLALAQTLLAQLDASAHANLPDRGKDDSAYATLQAQLALAVQTNIRILNISTLVLIGDKVNTILNANDSSSFMHVQSAHTPDELLFVSAIKEGQAWYQQSDATGQAKACVPFPTLRNSYPAMLCLDMSTDQLEAHIASELYQTGLIAGIALLISLAVVYSVLQHQHQYRLALELIQKQRDLFLNSALTDPLTGALNRRAFHLAFASAQSQLQRNQLPFAVITLDIDHFKEINDSFGHDLGDQVLAALVKNLQGGLRSSDHLARLGGEEFCIICNIPDRESALRMAEKVRLAAMNTNLEKPGNAEIRISVSLGIHIPGKGESLQDALKCADAALYAAKRAGRNQAVIFAAALAEPEQQS